MTQARGQLLQLLGMSNGGNNEDQESAKTLTMDQRLKLLDQIGTKLYSMFCKEYGIGQSTYHHRHQETSVLVV